MPVERVIVKLIHLRAEIANKTELERQIRNALTAYERGLERCECGGSAGDHAERCRLAEMLR